MDFDTDKLKDASISASDDSSEDDSDTGMSLADVDESTSSQSSSSSASSSSKEEFPRYRYETPFIAIYVEDSELVVRNRPQDEEIQIPYRQYSKESDFKLWESGLSDRLVKYWVSSWGFKSVSHTYKKEYDSKLIDDLRDKPRKTLARLKKAQGMADTNSPRSHTCAVCKDKFSDDQYTTVNGRYVHLDHTVAELKEAEIINQLRNKEVGTSKKTTDTERQTYK